ncbi:MAG: hypothetical protein ABR507_10785 [Actinomycetota bacterium]|nr:hypothetical protein [Actinomycetota bacterium]
MSEDLHIEVSGSPDPDEERAVIAALEKQFETESQVERPSAWKMTARALATRSGSMRHPRDTAWRLGLSTTTRSAPIELKGRGDVK